MYVAMIVALVVWAGVFVYLWRLDALARALKRQLDEQPTRAPVVIPKANLERRTTPVVDTGELAEDEQETQPPTFTEDRQPSLK